MLAALQRSVASPPHRKHSHATALSSRPDSSSPSHRPRLAFCTARVKSAAGNSGSVLQVLQAALDDFGPKSILPIRLEARLAFGEITLVSSGAASAGPPLDALEQDATENGFVLYARRADAIRKT